MNELSRAQLIAAGFEIIGRALIDLHYAKRTTEAGQELLVVAGQLKAAKHRDGLISRSALAAELRAVREALSRYAP